MNCKFNCGKTLDYTEGPVCHGCFKKVGNAAMSDGYTVADGVVMKPCDMMIDVGDRHDALLGRVEALEADAALDAQLIRDKDKNIYDLEMEANGCRQTIRDKDKRIAELEADIKNHENTIGGLRAERKIGEDTQAILRNEGLAERGRADALQREVDGLRFDVAATRQPLREMPEAESHLCCCEVCGSDLDWPAVKELIRRIRSTQPPAAYEFYADLCESIERHYAAPAKGKGGGGET